MKTIYAVSSGSYSDYRVDALFDDKELAQKYIDAFGGEYTDFNSIEEYVLNPCQKELNKGYKVFDVNISKDGAGTAEMSCSKGIEKPLYLTFWVNDTMNLTCFAKSESHALKIANEKRAQLIAENHWGREKYNEWIKSIKVTM